MEKTLMDTKTDSERLQKIWQAKRGVLQLSQSKVAEAFGIKNQTAISQYLNGKIPLNMEAAIKFAKVLQVNLEDISPAYGEWIYKPLPEPIKRACAALVKPGHTYASAVMSDASMEPLIPCGATVIVDTCCTALLDGVFAIQTTTNTALIRKVTVTKSTVILSTMDDQEDLTMPKGSTRLMSVIGKVSFIIKAI